MTGTNTIGKEEIKRRKTVSDYKSDTDDLHFNNSNGNSRAAAYREVRRKKEELEIKKINSVSSYYNDLLEH